MESFSQEYVLPWVINIALAVAIFVVGRLIVKLLMKVIGRLLRRSKMDEMLVTAGFAEELCRRGHADHLPPVQNR